jgi:hypothetical protein
MSSTEKETHVNPAIPGDVTKIWFRDMLLVKKGY